MIQFNLQSSRGKTWNVFLFEFLIYTGLFFLVYAIPTSHSNTFESIGVILVLLGCLALKYAGRDWNVRRNPFNLPIVLLFAAIVLSIFSSYRLVYTLNEIRGEFLTYIFLFYALSGFCQERERLLRVFCIFCFGNLLALLLFLYQFYLNDFSHNEFVRSLGTKQLFSEGLTELSSYFLVFSCLYYAALYFVTEKKYAMLLFLVLTLNLYMLYLSFQRAGIIAFGLVVFIPCFFPRQFPKNRFFIIGTVSLIVLFFVFTTPIKSKFVKKSWEPLLTWNFENLDLKDTVHLRLALYKHFWEAFKKHPFVGYGYGRSNLKKVDTESPKPRPRGLTHGHNAIYNFALETGLQGLAALLFLLFAKFRLFFKEIRRAGDSFTSFVFAGAFCLTTGFWTRMLFDDVYDSGIALAYWMVMAMAVGTYLGAKEGAEFGTDIVANIAERRPL